MSSQGRRRYQRSFAGCDNCKRRRVKCDEQKPRCARCLQRDEVCFYNDRAKYFKPGHDVDRRSPDTDIILQTIAAWKPLPGLGVKLANTSPETSTWLEYFAYEVSPYTDLGGICLLSEPSFTIQLCAAEPAVEFCISAIATLHYASWGLEKGREKFYFACIAKAIERLRCDDLEDESFIVASTLIRMAELIRNGDAGAMAVQLDVMQRFMQEWVSSSIGVSSRRRERRELLNKHWLPRLKACREYYGLENYQEVSTPPKSDGMWSHHDPKDNATALRDIMGKWILPASHSIDNKLTGRKRDIYVNIAARLEAWQNDLRGFGTGGAGLLKNDSTISTLRVHFLVAQLLALTLQDDHDHHDRRAYYEEILQLLEEQQETQFLGLGEKRLGLPLFAAPFFVATRCAHPSIRARAIRILRGFGFVEDGLWNSAVAAIIAEAFEPMLDSIQDATLEASNTTVDHQIQKVECTMQDSGSKAKLVIRYLTTSNGRREARAKLFVVENQRDIEACQIMEWPVATVVRSYGYISSVHLPVRFLVSNVNVTNILRHHRCANEEAYRIDRTKPLSLDAAEKSVAVEED